MNDIRLARIVLNTADAVGLARFYVDVLGFERVDDADRVALRLGGVRVDLRVVGADARPYPADVPGSSPLFQHFAIVVADMARAMDALGRSTAWSPISTDGPQTLPPNTGGVTAFKFRDPDGHPLEFLALPGTADATDSPFVRIDHSAISVADVDRSIAFYADFGLQVDHRSLNTGIEQQRLDGIVAATVDVVGLASTARAKPHVELLGYRGVDRSGDPPRLQVDDVAATRLVFESVADGHPSPGSATSRLLQDPDGHFIEIRGAA